MAKSYSLDEFMRRYLYAPKYNKVPKNIDVTKLPSLDARTKEIKVKLQKYIPYDNNTNSTEKTSKSTTYPTKKVHINVPNTNSTKTEQLKPEPVKNELPEVTVTPEKTETQQTKTTNRPLKKIRKKAKANGDYYTIKSGDTLSQIAKDLGVSIDTLAYLNGIKNKNKIRAGQKIRIKQTKPFEDEKKFNPIMDDSEYIEEPKEENNEDYYNKTKAQVDDDLRKKRTKQKIKYTLDV